MMVDIRRNLCIALHLSLITVACGVTDPNDLKVLNDFRDGLENPELLEWPIDGDDPCGPPKWPYVYCSGERVTQIQAKGLGLSGELPPSFNQLSKLSNLGLQRNNLSGALPSFSGLTELQYAYLDYNGFEAIPADFFDGLTSLQVLALDYNPLNESSGWSVPVELANSVQLTNLSLMNCNLVGPMPEFLGAMPSLTALKLSYNSLSGELPGSFNQSMLQILWLNDQNGGGIGGKIDAIASMASLTQLWLHGNQFTGTIPENIGALTFLTDLNLNRNKLVGLIPESLANMELEKLDLNNNLFMGPIPKFKVRNVTYDSNFFCRPESGMQCAPEVNALLDFLGGVGYPENLVTQWSGNSPCEGPWFGLTCNSKSKTSILNFPRRNLNGTLSASLASLDSLLEIRLGDNNIHGRVPENYTELKSLRLLDLSGNNLDPPLPVFRNSVKIIIDRNPLLVRNKTTPTVSPPPSSSPLPENTPPPPKPEISPSTIAGSNSSQAQPRPKGAKRFRMLLLFSTLILTFVLLMIILYICCHKKRKDVSEAPSSTVIHPRDMSGSENKVKIKFSNNTKTSLFSHSGTSSLSSLSNGTEKSRSIEVGNLGISVQDLRKVTKNFAPENELGKGGFGTVYKGELCDGTEIAVKRMESNLICSKALDEFRSEISVLTKVRHRHLVSLLGNSVEGSERLLVYEYMPQGALSRHLFHWKTNQLEPLTWRKRFTIALDVARGIEYLHSLAQHTFIHRDLKSSNILLGDDFRAKVSDFGLVKLAPDGERSFATQLAGTFGYLAPEYAVMGKITTKVDVYSYGVVLMELLTGLTALDEQRSEESRYLAEWFWRIRSSKEKFVAALDPAAKETKEALESIFIVAELAGHCTAREPHHRPDMSHVVNVLVPLVDQWKPMTDELEDTSGIDYNVPLPELLKVWQEAESKGSSMGTLGDSSGSIPAKPAGFAESFTSADGR